MESQTPKQKNTRRRGPRRRGGNKGGGERNPSSGNAASSSPRNNTPRGPPPAPLLRVTCRNIANAEKYGTAHALEPLIKSLIAKSNEKLSVKMELDQASLQTCLLEADAVTAARETFEKQQKEKAEGAKGDENTENVSEETPEGEVVSESPAEQVSAEASSTDNVPAPEPATPQEAPSNKILVRILYMVPPRKTRRRGEKPGCIYFVFNAPSMPAPPSPPTPSDETAAPYAESTPAVVPPPYDYTGELNKRRIMLVKALEVMTAIAADDAKTKQEYAGAVVSESASQKIWKRPPPNSQDRLEGTIFTTPAYLEFFAAKQKEEEARSARPRPAPGGATITGLPSSTSAVSNLVGVAAVTEDGQAVSNLVQHLLLKKKEQSKHKQVMRKSSAAKDAANKSKKSLPPLAAKDSGAGAKKNKKRKKKVAPVAAAKASG